MESCSPWNHTLVDKSLNFRVSKILLRMKIIPSEGLENLWRGQWTEIIINWRFLPICWFKEGCLLLLRRYLEVLKNKLWSDIRSDPDLDQYYCRQGGATLHFSRNCLSFFDENFNARIISRRTDQCSSMSSSKPWLGFYWFLVLGTHKTSYVFTILVIYYFGIPATEFKWFGC